MQHPAQLPRISAADKKDILHPTEEMEGGVSPESWKHDGVPLFWNESKTKEFWREWINMFDIKTVVDLSPGTGQLAIAVLSQGVQYIGVTTHERHMSWLMNIIDREALRCIGESDSALYHQELSVLIAEHFADVLEELNAEQPEEDEGEEDDE